LQFRQQLAVTPQDNSPVARTFRVPTELLTEQPMKLSLSTALTASALALAPLSAGAATFTISDLANGAGPQVLNNGGVTATFNAFASSGAAGSFQDKTIGAYTGVGVLGGRTNDELDINGEGQSEKITVGFSPNVGIGLIQVAFLYDGPEFNDVNEVAVITTNTGVVGELTATYTNASGLEAYWDVIGDALAPVLVTNLSPAIDPNGSAVWSIQNPFGAIGLSGLAFTARNGACGNGTCSNQSDYALYKIETFDAPQEVPEPSTYAMMLAGLAMLGFMVRRRSQS
jgi:hypothetical protein